MREEFIVQFKTADVERVMAVSYIVDEEALIFLNEKVELVAFFDLTEVAVWRPKLSGDANS